jgi:MFS family permease
LPLLQSVIARHGWRSGCWLLGSLVLILLVPPNLLLRHRPEDIGLTADGDGAASGNSGSPANIVDRQWTAIDWTLPRALGTARFWWIALGYFCGLYVWYAVQVHQTEYLIEIGFSPATAAWALGAVSLAAVPGQIALGHLSDRIGREWVWTIGNAGFVLCSVLLIALGSSPRMPLLYPMVLVQGLLGYGLTSVMGAIPAEIFEGPNFGSIFGTIMVAAILGGAVGPWATGVLHDHSGNYLTAFASAIGFSLISAIAIWLAAPRRVRSVAGRARGRAAD